ncbi:CsbD family protein [Paracoccaceae bacterium Fryx2]|nr:CsbD family protein [Paracoccaceae bacterium Fryx2]
MNPDIIAGKLGKDIMDKDRIKGAAQQAKGGIKVAVGKATGDTGLKVEGQLDKAEGKVRSAVGEAKDNLRKI